LPRNVDHSKALSGSGIIIHGTSVSMMSDPDPDPVSASKELRSLARGDWEARTVGSGHLVFVHETFPAQIEVAYQPEQDEWTVGLHVYNESRETMDLLSADYSATIASAERSELSDVITEYMSQIESGKLDEYRSATAGSSTS
jgi:hypothetical protein